MSSACSVPAGSGNSQLIRFPKNPHACHSSWRQPGAVVYHTLERTDKDNTAAPGCRQELWKRTNIFHDAYNTHPERKGAFHRCEVPGLLPVRSHDRHRQGRQRKCGSLTRVRIKTCRCAPIKSFKDFVIHLCYQRTAQQRPKPPKRGGRWQPYNLMGCVSCMRA